MASKYSEALRQLLEAELECPWCHAYNTVGRTGKHIVIDEYGLAVCMCCLKDFRPDPPR